GPDPHTCRSRNPPLEDPPQFFGFLGKKILEIKIVLLASPRRGRYASSRSDSLAPLVTIFLATHPATPVATAPSPVQDKCCTEADSRQFDKSAEGEPPRWLSGV